jgi:hypothetical protein
MPAAAAALTSLGHATPAAGAGQTGQWFRRSGFGSQIWYFFFSFLFCSYLLEYLTTCYFVSSLVTLTES